MRSTFHGLETAKRGMYAQQGALYTTGHNISNANTLGYTRQRVNLEQTEPYPAPSMNRPNIPGQMGTGVEAGSIQRIRDSFLDVQYRGENNKLGYWETKMEALKKMEEVMNEPSDSGLSKTMDQFWQSLQDLAVNPTNSGARSVVRQRGIAVAETFNYLSSSLNHIRSDLKNELGVTETQINSYLKQINDLNKQIGDVEPHGYLPNDLYDERDRLIDELSQIVNIQVTYQSSGGDALEIADGQAIINLIGDDGKVAANLLGIGGQKKVEFTYSGEDQGFQSIKIGSKEISVENFTSVGKLKGLIEAYGYQDSNGNTLGLYPNMLAELDNMAYTFANEFNNIHAEGMSPSEIANGVNKPIPFFSGSTIAEVAFIIDNTGSMTGTINNVKQNIGKFASGLSDYGIETQLGLVSFGDQASDGSPIKYPLSTVEDFLDSMNMLDASGGDGTPEESGLEGIADPNSGSLSYTLETDNIKHFVLVTDQPVHDNDDGDGGDGLSTLDIDEVAQLLKDKGIKLTVVSRTSNAQLERLSDPTGGGFLDIDGDFEAQLRQLATSIASDMGPKKGFASRIDVSQPIKENVDNIATASETGTGGGTLGDASTILELADVFNKELVYNEKGTTANFRNYYEGIIGEMAVKSQESIRLTNNSDMLRQSVEERRMSVSAVSLDEEMTNMIKFQHAYNASARMITLQDEMLDKIINGMGTVGR